MRSLVASFVFVASLVVACAPSMDADAPHPAICDMRLRQVAHCEGTSDDSLETLQSLRQKAPGLRATTLQLLEAFHCPEPIVRTSMSSLDTCAATVDALYAQAAAETATRRAAAGPAVADLRADARYARTLDDLHLLQKEERVACTGATQGTTQCEAAHLETVRATATLRELMNAHHIDLRDANALGLW